MRKRIQIDFDNTIYQPPEGEFTEEMTGELIEGAVEAIEKLHEDFDLCVFTARDNLIPVRDWIDKNIFSKIDRFDFQVTNKKYPSEFYIDDRAIRFENWEDTFEQIADYSEEAEAL